MSKSIELLLTDTVENLGIVGDVVSVRSGYARNYLLPRNLATTPSEEKIKELATRRAEAEKHIAEMRQQRESMVEKLEGVEVTLERSCNDQGLLYGSVTQQDIASALVAQGFSVRPRDVRMAQTIKRIDSYEIHIRPEADLEAIVKLWVVADRELNLDKRRDEREFDDEGNVVEKHARKGAEQPAEAEAEAPAGDEKPAKKARKPKSDE